MRHLLLALLAVLVLAGSVLAEGDGGGGYFKPETKGQRILFEGDGGGGY